MQVIAVPGSEMPAGHEWLVVALGMDVTAFVVASALDHRLLVEVAQAVARVS